MFQLFRIHLAGYRRQAIYAPALIILEVLCELMLPLVMAEIVDVAIPTANTAYIFKLGGLMVVLSAIALLCGVLASKYAAISSQGFGANLRQSLFDQIQEFSFGDIDRFSSASLITRATNDVNAMTMMLSVSLRVLVRAPMMLVMALVVSLSLNVEIAMILVLVIPIMFVIIGVLLHFCFPMFDKLQRQIDGINKVTQENLMASRVVKAFVRQHHEGEKFKVANDNLTRVALSVGTLMCTVMPILILALNGASLAVLRFGGEMVMLDTLPLGDLSAFFNYLFQVMMSIMMVGLSLVQFSRAKACAMRIKEVLDAVPSIIDGNCPAALPVPRGEITFQNVSFRYQQEGEGDDVLSDLSFTIPSGQFLAIVGGTGTGKSSLVNLIPRFYDVTRGSVLVDGLDVRSYPVDALRRRIGMVLQSNLLFTGSVRENLLWGDATATDEQLWTALQNAQVHDFVKNLPDGLDSLLSQGGVNLSGGQKQRLCIARAMLKQPSILILDDSTSAVDSTTEKAIRDTFHHTLKNTTIIMIAQRISSVRYADEILVLDDGAVVGKGTHSALLETNQIYREIYQSQQEEVVS